ncbi:hypothetical protein [Nocardia tengchongensis]|uniref:hypothetical protein n=1 Tax=Nocardia tengchongensis TaxID=2055889 RepID=UPI00365CBFDB
MPPDIHRYAEPAAGEFYPAIPCGQRNHSRRPQDEWFPDIDYLLRGTASTAAVVAAFTGMTVTVPERHWSKLFTLYCPRAAGLLSAAGIPIDHWRRGRGGVIEELVCATANTELGGFAVFRF